MNAVDGVVVVLLGAGAFFFLAGTLGVLRFPDARSRLHAVTKADNLGLGLIVAALALRSSGISEVGKLLLIWVVVLVASATSSYLIASTAAESDGVGD